MRHGRGPLAAALAVLCLAGAAAHSPARAQTASRDSAEYWLGQAARDLNLDDVRARAADLMRAANVAQSTGNAAAFRRATLLRVQLLSSLGAGRSAAQLLKSSDAPSDPPELRVPYLCERAGTEAARGRFDASDATLKEALRLALPRLNAAPWLALRVLELQAAAASSRNHDEEAAALWMQMRAIARGHRLTGESARAEILLGRQALWNHDRESGRAWAIAALNSAYGSRDTARIAEALLLRGLIHVSDARLPEARALLGASRVLARHAGEDVIQAAAEQGLGDADARENRSATAYQWYSRAAASLDRAELARWKRPFVPGSPWLGARAVLRRRLNLALWDRDPARSWQIQEDDRTQALLRALSGSATNRLPRWTEDELARAREIAEQRNALIARNELGDSAWGPVVSAYDELAGRVKQRFLSEIRLEAGSADALRGALPEHTALVQFSLSPTSAVAWVATRDSIRLASLGDGRGLSDALGAVIGAVRRGGAAAPDSSLRILETRLQRGLEARLPPDVHHVIYVPDGQMLYASKYLPGGGDEADAPLEVSWAASSGAYVRMRQRAEAARPAAAWRVTLDRSANTPSPRAPWAAALGAGGAVTDTAVTDAEGLLAAASGAALWVYEPGVRISDRRPEQCEWLPPAGGGGDTSWLSVVELARSREDAEVGVLVLPQAIDRLEREGSGLGSVGTAYASMLTGARTVALQTGGSRGELLAAWAAEFLARIRKSETPSHAARGATAAVRASHPSAAAGSIPSFALFGDTQAPPPFPGPRLVEPWVLASIAISGVMGLGLGLRSWLRSRT